MYMASFKKFVRPEMPRAGLVSERDLDLIEAILRYRFIPASALIRVVGGNEDVTHRRLRKLWEWGTINRWAFPGLRTHSEFHYYLDNRAALDTLVLHERLPAAGVGMLDEIRDNRERGSAAAVLRGQHMQLGFLQHSLMISRMHFMLEMSERATECLLQSWAQGSQLAGRKVDVPRIKSSRVDNQYFWQESQSIERLPIEPDALFTLQFSTRPEGDQLAHFFYEADRGTMTTTAMFRKFRAYWHFVKKQQHREAFGFHPVRAVLIETTTEARARRLMELVRHPLIGGSDRRTGLFWFTISPLFTNKEPSEETGGARVLPRWLTSPDGVMGPIWAMPDGNLRTLADVKNS